MKYLLLSILLVVPAACVRVPRPELPEHELAGEEYERVLAGMREGAAQARSLKVLARTTIRHKQDTASLRHAVAAAEEGRLRVDTLAAGSAYTLGLLVAHGEEALFLDTAEREAYQGKGTELVKKALGLPLDVREVPSYLAGRIPAALLKRGAAEGMLRIYRPSNGDELIAVWKDFRYYWRLDPQSFMLREVQYRTPHNDRLYLSMRYPSSAHGELPQHLTIELPGDNILVELEYTSASLNPPVNPRLFEVSIPADYEVHNLGE